MNKCNVLELGIKANFSKSCEKVIVIFGAGHCCDSLLISSFVFFLQNINGFKWNYG